MTSLELRKKIEEDLKSTQREGIDNLLSYMAKYDYFTAPASSNYHSNVDGGLAYHSYLVQKLLLEKKQRYNLDITEAECKIAGYLHDLCKMNMYKRDMKLKKDSSGKKWVAYPVYTIDEDFPIGHADKSIILASRFIKLTANEIYMIKYHMGIPTEYADNKAYGSAVKKCPAIVAMQTADMEASMILEKITDLSKQEIDIEDYNKFKASKVEENSNDSKID